MINKTKKFVATIMVMMTILSSFGKVFATEINSAEIYGKGEMEYHLQYWNDERGGWYYVICNPAFYSYNGVEYPAYCVNSDLPGKCKSYPVFYGRTTVAGTQNYALAFDPFGDGNGRTTLNIKNNNGKVVVNKTDSQTHKVIEGVEFALKNEEGTIIAKSKTNGDGVAVFDNLYKGNYKLVETETNKDYILNTDEKDVYVEYNKTANVDVTNDHKEGNVKVYKIDKDNHRVVQSVGKYAQRL